MRQRINVGVPRRIIVASTNEDCNRVLSDLQDRNSVLSKGVIISEKKGVGRDKIVETSVAFPGKSHPVVVETMPYTRRLLKAAKCFSL